MTVIRADVLLVSKREDMKVIISDLKSSLETNFKTTLASEIDARKVRGSAYAQSKHMMKKLDTLLLR